MYLNKIVTIGLVVLAAAACTETISSSGQDGGGADVADVGWSWDLAGDTATPADVPPETSDTAAPPDSGPDTVKPQATSRFVLWLTGGAGRATDGNYSVQGGLRFVAPTLSSGGGLRLQSLPGIRPVQGRQN